MRFAAAVALGFLLAACGAEAGKTQQSPSRVSVTDLSDTPVPTFDGQLIIGDELGVFGMVLRENDEAEPGFILVEMLTSQTTSQMRMGSAKIDAMSFVYQLDCSTMRYRLANQVDYRRDGQPMYRVNLDNALIDGPMADYLQPACGRAPPEGIQLGTRFSSMGTFLAIADTILAPRRAALPRAIITGTSAPPRN
jgi:hypothetical protein